jgi:hypothetical protein
MMSRNSSAKPTENEHRDGELQNVDPTPTPEELLEITHNCWKDWDEILMILKEYYLLHIQT